MSGLVARALAEDVGTGDVTTAATVDADARGRATIVQKAPGVIFGIELVLQGPTAAVERRQGAPAALVLHAFL